MVPNGFSVKQIRGSCKCSLRWWWSWWWWWWDRIGSHHCLETVWKNDQAALSIWSLNPLFPVDVPWNQPKSRGYEPRIKLCSKNVELFSRRSCNQSWRLKKSLSTLNLEPCGPRVDLYYIQLHRKSPVNFPITTIYQLIVAKGWFLLPFTSKVV